MSILAPWELIKQTVADWLEDEAPRLGAALAFYSVLSLAPLLVIVLAIAGRVFDEEAARGEIVSQIEGLVGHDGAIAIQDLIAHARRPAEGILATLLGSLTLFFGASGVFGELQDSLNTIWNVQPKPGRAIWTIIRERFFSFAMVLGCAFLLIVSLVVGATLSAAGKYISGWLPASQVLLPAAGMVISFLVFTLLFAAILKFVPDVRIAWRDVWLGALVTSALFTVGKFALGLYLGRSGISSAYGAAGSLVVLVIWVYYSAQILFFGAELTQAQAHRRGSAITPSPNAERLKSERGSRVHDSTRQGTSGQSTFRRGAPRRARNERLTADPRRFARYKPARVGKQTGLSVWTRANPCIATLGIAIALFAVRFLTPRDPDSSRF